MRAIAALCTLLALCACVLWGVARRCLRDGRSAETRDTRETYGAAAVALAVLGAALAVVGVVQATGAIPQLLAPEGTLIIAALRGETP